MVYFQNGLRKLFCSKTFIVNQYSSDSSTWVTKINYHSQVHNSKTISNYEKQLLNILRTFKLKIVKICNT